MSSLQSITQSLPSLMRVQKFLKNKMLRTIFIESDHNRRFNCRLINPYLRVHQKSGINLSFSSNKTIS